MYPGSMSEMATANDFVMFSLGKFLRIVFLGESFSGTSEISSS